MDVSIIGAGGTIGRQIAITLVQSRLLSPTSSLQLVGRADGKSAREIYGLATDLADGYAEFLPEIDVALRPEDVLGDIIIFAAGQTAESLSAGATDRLKLARHNQKLFSTYARAIADHAHGEEIILVVTNPVELGVSIFSQHHPRERVVGMGSFLDTLRFRNEIADELGIRRQSVQGLVLGEHGLGMVPCWSTVSAYGFASPDGQAALAQLQRPAPPHEDAIRDVLRCLTNENPAAAYQLCNTFPADLRTLARPMVTHFSGARTPVGSASMIARLVEIILHGGRMLTAAQVELRGEFLDIHGVTGVPVVISSNGIERIESTTLTDAEAVAVRAAAMRTSQYLAEVQS